MKILLFFSISFFFDVFIPPVGSRSVGISVPPSKVPCLLKLEKLYSETRNSSTIFENAQYGTEEKQKAESKKHYALFNLTRACIMFGGHCKNKCGENEFRMVYCDVSTSLCCIRQCKPKKYK
ncbi:PREDICTED: beta-defensin 112 [Capra hircus]|uniref:Beta-defensin n=1 Tax=Capra hircus TaxID=9925 RepID=A0A452DXB7_CAPHI|nr:PREDICTED: beta-defensin 112 [Capra hircus]